MIEKVELMELPLFARTCLDDYPLVKAGLELSAIRDDLLRGLTYQIKTYILAEEIDHQEKEVTLCVDVPSSWWQHFKRDAIPVWLYQLLRLKPVDYTRVIKQTKVVFSRKATYPKASIMFPDKVGPLVRYVQSCEERSY